VCLIIAYRSARQSNVDVCRSRVRDSELDVTWLVTFVESLEDVTSWEEDPPELAVSRGFESNVAVAEFQADSFDGKAFFVVDETADAAVNFAEEAHERLAVLLPVPREIFGRGVLAARDLQSHFHASVPHVVVVLHSP